VLEAQVMNHLDSLIGSVQNWITEQLAERDSERQERMKLVDRERATLADLDTKRDKRMEDTTPSVDEALDYYLALADLIQGKAKAALGLVELNEALSSVLADLWAELEPERDRLLVQFESQ
jgi:hypothetical protein